MSKVWIVGKGLLDENEPRFRSTTFNIREYAIENVEFRHVSDYTNSKLDGRSDGLREVGTHN